jgi:bacillithiol biosynthesis cysteine-adding enzyme BshC
MESICIRQTEIPHTTPLFADFLYHFDRVAPFYDGRSLAADRFADLAERIEYPAERRAALVAALREINPDSPALEQLARPGTFVVATGQQVGLFSGPCYTIYKALTAVKLARRLSNAGIPAVPVFWLATEDHDAAEVDHCWVFDGGRRPAALHIDLSAAAGQPVGRIAVGDFPVAGLRAALAGLPHGEEVADLVEGCYQPGLNLGQAFQRLVGRLLRSHGLLFVDPLRPRIRELAAPLLRRAAEAGEELIERLLERNRALEAAGYHAQVHLEPGSSLFFLLNGSRRIALRRSGELYRSGERSWSRTDLTAAPERLSPNALLRPVVQDFILPTVAYVGGPAEVAYLAQSQVLYQHLLGYMPVPLARSAFTLLDGRAAKLIRRYGLAFADFHHGLQPLKERIARKLVPADLEAALHGAQAAVSSELDRLRGVLAGFDATLAQALDKSRAKILYQLAKIERKTAREALRRNARAAEEAEYLSNLIAPHKHLQERFYTILPFLAQHGWELLDTLYEAVNLDCPDHLVLTV